MSAERGHSNEMIMVTSWRDCRPGGVRDATVHWSGRECESMKKAR